MVNVKLLREHLDSICPQEHLAVKDGITYLPIDKCERMLDQLCAEFNLMWSTGNYNSKIYDINGEILISASLELLIKGEGYSKRLVGTTTFYASAYGQNTFYDSIAKSLCTVNAASDLGDYFGRYLASQEKGMIPPAGSEKTKRSAVKTTPDGKVRTAYARAVANRNEAEVERLERIYDFTGK